MQVKNGRVTSVNRVNFVYSDNHCAFVADIK